MGNVIVINPIEVPKGQEEQALAMWDRFAEYFRRQPGYLSVKLHRAINPNARFHLVTIAEWESPNHFMAALNNQELRKIVETAFIVAQYAIVSPLIAWVYSRQS